MNEIEAYLSTPPNERLYSTGLKLLFDHGLPQFDTLYQSLSKGAMGRNRQKLFDTLQLLSKTKKPKTIEIVVKESPSNSLTPSTRLELDLLLQVRKTKQKRAQISQMFHACKTDQERAEICDLIDKATNELKTQQKNLAHVQRFGILPQQETEFEPLPNTMPELIVERDRISKHIYALEKRIAFLHTLPENSPKRKKLPSKEEDLRIQFARKQACRQKINILKQQKDG